MPSYVVGCQNVGDYLKLFFLAENEPWLLVTELSVGCGCVRKDERWEMRNKRRKTSVSWFMKEREWRAIKPKKQG